MIDVWLLFNLLMPFAEVRPKLPFIPFQVLLQTYIEYLRGLVEEAKTINHHGKEITVDPVDNKPAPIFTVEP
jgi:hypothetical protein